MTEHEQDILDAYYLGIVAADLAVVSLNVYQDARYVNARQIADMLSVFDEFAFYVSRLADHQSATAADVSDGKVMNSHIDEFADLFELSEFIGDCELGMFTDYDGHGYLVKGKTVDRSQTILPSMLDTIDLNGVTHILWFNT